MCHEGEGEGDVQLGQTWKKKVWSVSEILHHGHCRPRPLSLLTVDPSLRSEQHEANWTWEDSRTGAEPVEKNLGHRRGKE
jgi:hypothetical protein